MATIRVKDDAHWRELRRQHVGGSEVAALFGEHPYLTRFELWHRKKGTLPEPDLSENERVFWGTLLEPAVAAGVASKTGWKVQKVRRYYSLRPDLGLGASLDYEIIAHDRGPGVLEIKTADWLVVRGWENGEPPLSYELQVQLEMRASGRRWGAMGVLVGGNDLRLFEYERRDKTIGIIEREIDSFWKSIEGGIEPKPDFARDGQAIGALYGVATPDKIVDLSDSNRLPILIDEYKAAQALKNENDKKQDAAKAEIMALVGDAEFALCGDWRIKTSMVAGQPDRLITEAMVGETIKGRKGYRGLWISQRKEKAT